jgi:hypothetical protein
MRHTVVACLVLGLALPPAARGFQFPRHPLITEDALTAAGAPPAVVRMLMYYSGAPDVQGCLDECYACPEVTRPLVEATGTTCPTDEGRVESFYSKFHFDNQQVQESRSLVRTRIERTRRKLLRIDPSDGFSKAEANRFESAMEDFGEALHALQDFYAHSTWVDCTGDDPKQPLWDGRLGLDCTVALDEGPEPTASGLTTGCSELPSRCSGAHHDYLCKDGPTTPQGKGRLASGKTRYEVASGGPPDEQFATDYSQDGWAVRHTIRAYYSLIESVRPFRCCPVHKAEKIKRCGGCGASSFADAAGRAADDKHIQAVIDEAGKSWRIAERASLLPADPWPVWIALENELLLPWVRSVFE